MNTNTNRIYKSMMLSGKNKIIACPTTGRDANAIQREFWENAQAGDRAHNYAKMEAKLNRHQLALARIEKQNEALRAQLGDKCIDKSDPFEERSLSPDFRVDVRSSTPTIMYKLLKIKEKLKGAHEETRCLQEKFCWAPRLKCISSPILLNEDFENFDAFKLSSSTEPSSPSKVYSLSMSRSTSPLSSELPRFTDKPSCLFDILPRPKLT